MGDASREGQIMTVKNRLHADLCISWLRSVEEWKMF